MAILLKTDGNIETFNPDGDYLSLEQLQKAVGGYIEIVNVLDGYVLIINEEGKLQNLPYNEEATDIYRRSGNLTDIIVGDVVFALSTELEE